MDPRTKSPRGRGPSAPWPKQLAIEDAVATAARAKAAGKANDSSHSSSSATTAADASSRTSKRGPRGLPSSPPLSKAGTTKQQRGLRSKIHGDQLAFIPLALLAVMGLKMLAEDVDLVRRATAGPGHDKRRGRSRRKRSEEWEHGAEKEAWKRGGRGGLSRSRSRRWRDGDGGVGGGGGREKGDVGYYDGRRGGWLVRETEMAEQGGRKRRRWPGGMASVPPPTGVMERRDRGGGCTRWDDRRRGEGAMMADERRRQEWEEIARIERENYQRRWREEHYGGNSGDGGGGGREGGRGGAGAYCEGGNGELDDIRSYMRSRPNHLEGEQPQQQPHQQQEFDGYDFDDDDDNNDDAVDADGFDDGERIRHYLEALPADAEEYHHHHHYEARPPPSSLVETPKQR